MYLIEYITDSCNAGLSHSTIVSRISAVSYIHKMAGAEDPSQPFVIQKMLTGFRKLTKRSDVRLPITKEILTDLMGALLHTSESIYIRCMMRAMFSLAFFGLLRVGEITVTDSQASINVLHLNNIVFDPPLPHSRTILLTMHHYKHSGPTPTTLQIGLQPGDTCPVAALAAYISYRGNSPGPLFIFPNTQPVSRQYFTDQLNLALRWCKLDTNYYKGHSFRIGAATTAARLGASDAQIEAMGRWSSKAYKRYIRIPTITSF